MGLVALLNLAVEIIGEQLGEKSEQKIGMVLGLIMPFLTDLLEAKEEHARARIQIEASRALIKLGLA